MPLELKPTGNSKTEFSDYCGGQIYVTHSTVKRPQMNSIVFRNSNDGQEDFRITEINIILRSPRTSGNNRPQRGKKQKSNWRNKLSVISCRATAKNMPWEISKLNPTYSPSSTALYIANSKNQRIGSDQKPWNPLLLIRPKMQKKFGKCAARHKRNTGETEICTPKMPLSGLNMCPKTAALNSSVVKPAPKNNFLLWTRISPNYYILRISANSTQK